MNHSRLQPCLLFLLGLTVFSYDLYSQSADTAKTTLKPMLISFNPDSSAYQELLSGPPSCSGMYSGLVTLLPDETVGHHNTEEYEEMLVILSGEGEMIFSDKKTFKLKYGVVAYCPPHTEHDVKNTSSIPLKYIYTASKTK
jgi:quercetin dioxygenase-like cupin family protein